MRKIVTILCVCLCLGIFVDLYTDADALISVVITNNVEGKAGKAIEDSDVVLTFNQPDDYFWNTDNIAEYDDITDWFTNIPTDCNYSVEVKSVSETELIATFSGSIGASAPLTDGTPIELTVPYLEGVEYILAGVNPYEADLSDVANSNASYIIKEDKFEIEYYGPYTVSGTVGVELTPQDVVVHIVDRGPLNIDFDPTAVTNTLDVVNGLTPTITAFDDTLDLITITYTGTPISASSELIHTTFAQADMVNATSDIEVADREDVKFNIVPKSRPTPSYVPPHTGIN